MKKLIVNVLLFIAGYLLITFAISVVYNLCLDYSEIVTNIPSNIAGNLIGIILFILGAISSAWCGLNLIKQAFLPGLDARFALKKGQVVEAISDEEGVYPRFYIQLKYYPFEEKSKIMEVSFCMHQKITRGHRYFFDGSGLTSVLK